MKLAKKALALVMALGLIVCTAAMVFAVGESSADKDANKPAEKTYTVEVLKNGKTVVAAVYADNMVGLVSGLVTLSVENLTYKRTDLGADAENCSSGKVEGNNFAYEVNANSADKVIFGFYFKENLWSADAFATKISAEGVKINSDHFELGRVVFERADENAQFSVTAVADSKFTDGSVVEAVVVKDAIDMPETTTGNGISETTTGGNVDDSTTTTGNSDVTTTTADNTTAVTTTAAPTTTVKSDGGKNTGDNGILAVMAGIAVLGGAALAVTKKRK